MKFCETLCLTENSFLLNEKKSMFIFFLKSLNPSLDLGVSLQGGGILRTPF